MSKPLELTIYGYDREQYGYADPAGWIYPDQDVDYFAEQKRLSEAEMAAEYWQAEKGLGDIRGIGGSYLGLEPEMLQQVITLHRFAIHPHYFEATEPESDTE